MSLTRKAKRADTILSVSYAQTNVFRLDLNIARVEDFSV